MLRRAPLPPVPSHARPATREDPVCEQSGYSRRQVLRLIDRDITAGREESIPDRSKILEMRAGDHRLGAKRRLEDVVPAAIRERTAHEHDVANGKERAQLPHGIESRMSGAGLTRNAERRTKENPLC